MSKELVLPELAESVVEGEIVRWLVEEGDEIHPDQPVVEVMTDKVTVELPSPYAGVLEQKLAQEGDVVAVHQAIARISEETVQGKPTQASNSAQQSSVAVQEERSIVEPSSAQDTPDEDLSLFTPEPTADASSESHRARQQSGNKQNPQEPTTGAYGRVLAVPAARKLARELGLDITEVPGNGPNGRVGVDDVRAYADQADTPQKRPGSAAAATRQASRYRSPEAYRELEERTPLRGLRRAISNQMVASHLQSVRTLHVDEADVSHLVLLRERLNSLLAEQGVKLSYLPFIMKAAVAALKRYPMLNASLDEEAGEIVTKHYYNLGLAVATEQGLVVPVVKDVDQKSLLEIARDLRDLADKARAGKLSPEEVSGGTFSITNIGPLGGLFSFPIINVPEAAILGVHSIKKRPVVVDDERIVARHMLYLSMSFDHRLVDGAEAAQATGHIIKLLETPESLLLEGVGGRE